ncbi:hypothetical protein [Nioella sp.]|uniref:hypothetical protein n=1 Tax=Nioella sp. TaxID=1912091 RepID=UPI003517BCFF
MTRWSDLSPEAQLALRMAYDKATGTMPGTCSLEDKIQRFSDWLAGQGVAYGAEDLPERYRPRG